MESERTPDSDGDLPDADGFGIAELRVDELRGMDADDRQIRLGVLADQTGAERPAIRQRDLHPVCAMNHVAVSKNEAVWRDNKAGASAGGFRATPPIAVAVAHTDVHH